MVFLLFGANTPRPRRSAAEALEARELIEAVDFFELFEVTEFERLALAAVLSVTTESDSGFDIVIRRPESMTATRS